MAIEKLNRNRILQTASCAVLGVAVTGGIAQGVTNYTYSGAAQTWTVPATGIYDIVASGAQGGTDGDGTLGGKGAQVGGFFSLVSGQSITIDVGGQGGTGGPAFGGYGGGGGGGSFVYDATTSTLLAAAGGGGGGYMSGQVGGVGQITLGLFPGSGAAGSGYGGGGGGGFSSGGTGGSGGDGFPGLAGGGPGFIGAAPGGFGGGGGSGGYGAGGGGGYSGGNPGVPGGGGYSFNGGTSQTNTAGFESGNGAVAITAISVPEPASAALVGFAAFAVVGGRRRKQV